MRTVVVVLEAKIDAFTAKMAQAGKAAAGIGDAAKGAGKGAQREFEVLKDTAMQNEQEWSKVAKTIGAVGLAAGAVAGLAVREFSKFDAAMSGVASTGADAKASIDALRDAAIQQGADTAYSATEAAQGIEELARAGVTAEEILGGGLAGALSLAAAGQIGVADAAGIASTAMTQFKLSGEQIPHLADLLAAGAGKAMGGVDDLGMALKQSGLVASQFGLDIEETVGGLSAFAAAGLLGSDAGTSLKTMLLKLAKPSKEAQTLMDDLGISAYDAQGQFVGLEGLAGQLSDKMGGLTDAQRQSALATIFGTDAIRAASVLYENGAEGIAEWTAAVNDSGYAARTAAELQNNLIGDLEKLGGSWSTLAIQMGETADGPLRSIVQALTGLVDIAGEAPGAAQSLMIGTTALAGLALGGAALMKGISGLAQYQTAMATLASSSPGIHRTARAVGAVGKALGVAGLAVVGLQTLGTILESTTAQTHGLEATATALTRVATGIETIQSLDALFKDKNDDTRQMTEGLFNLSGGVGDLTSAFRYLNEGANEWSNLGNGAYWDSLGNSFAKLVSIGTLETSADKLKTVFDEMDTSLQGMSFEDATASFAALRTELEMAGATDPQILAFFDSYRDKVDAAAAAAGLKKLADEDMLTLMSGGVVEGFTLAAAAAGEFGAVSKEAANGAQIMADAVQADVDAMHEVLDAAQGAADAIQSLNDAQRDAANLFMGAQAAGDNYIATLQGLKDQIKENGTSTDELTEKGRANREYLRGLATDGRAATDAMIANGDSVDVVNAKMSTTREEFLGVAGRFKITGQAAQDMADDFGLIPNYVPVLIAVEGGKLGKQEADDLNAALEGIDDETKAKIITVAIRSGYDEAIRLLNDANGRSASMTIRINTIGGGAIGAGSMFKRAQGGPIYGPGTPTSDSIPIMASNGEFMVRTWAVNKIGAHRMAYMNATGKIPHFNTGGQVTPNGPATVGAYAAAGAAGGVVNNNNTTFNMEGREAMAAFLDQIRYGTRLDYMQNGVHRA